MNIEKSVLAMLVAQIIRRRVTIIVQFNKQPLYFDDLKINKRESIPGHKQIDFNSKTRSSNSRSYFFSMKINHLQK